MAEGKHIMSKPERVDKILSNMGYGTRSGVKKILKTGRVEVEGKLVTDGSQKVLPESGNIKVDGCPLVYKKFVYLMLNKPKDYISATKDQHQKTVADLVPAEYRCFGLFPVGRLDIDTEGLLLLTNDGDLAHCILSPKRNVKKKYYTLLDKPINEDIVRAFESGVEIGNGDMCRAAELNMVNDTEAEITITEGKHHQIKRMFSTFGINVVYLKRTEMAGIQLDQNLDNGCVRELSPEETELITQLKT